MDYNYINKYIKDSFLRHYNKKGEGSLTGLSLSISENKDKKGEDIIFLNGIEFIGKNKGDKIKNRISLLLNDEDLIKIENSLLFLLGYDEKYEKNIIDNDYYSLNLDKDKFGNIIIEFIKKQNNNEDKNINKDELKQNNAGDLKISFDMNILEVNRLLKNIYKIKYIKNNRKELDYIININKLFNGLSLENKNKFSIEGSDGTNKIIQKTTVQHSAINIQDKKLIGSFLKFRNEYLFLDINNNDNIYSQELGSKYPITIVTQENGYSFSLPIEEELSLLLEKFLKAYALQPERNKKYLTDIENNLLKNNKIIGTYNNKGTEMLQFKIYGETGTIQYSINQKDKSLTVARIGIASEQDVNRIKNNLIKIKTQIESQENSEEELNKLKNKYKNLLEFGKKLDYSNKTKTPYFTTYLKIDNPLEFIFSLNLINSYLINPLKHEKDILFKNLDNLLFNINNGKIKKDDDNVKQILKLVRGYFGSDIKLNNNTILYYDYRNLFKILKDTDKNKSEIFNLYTKIDGKLINLSLTFEDIKNIRNKKNFIKNIYSDEIGNDGKKILKIFNFINDNGSYNLYYNFNGISGKNTILNNYDNTKFEKTVDNIIERLNQNNGKNNDIINLEGLFKNDFFEINLKLNENITLQYDARFVDKLLNQEEEKGNKTFKFIINFNGEENKMYLDLNDIKKIKDTYNFYKKIDFELNGKKIFKELSISKLDDNNLKIIYKNGEKINEGKININHFNNIQDFLQKNIIIGDIYHGGFYDKNYSYLLYKIENFNGLKNNINNGNKNIFKKIKNI